MFELILFYFLGLLAYVSVTVGFRIAASVFSYSAYLLENRHNQSLLERLSPPVTVFDFIHSGFAPRLGRSLSGSCEIELLFFVISVFRACKWMRLRPHPQHGSMPFCVNEKHHCPQQTLMTGTKTLTTSTLSNVQALVVFMKSFLWWLICGKSSKFAQYLIHFELKK